MIIINIICQKKKIGFQLLIWKSKFGQEIQKQMLLIFEINNVKKSRIVSKCVSVCVGEIRFTVTWDELT